MRVVQVFFQQRVAGRKGVVVQQDGARVVHVYGENRVEVLP
jgi:hypothetical protein